MIPLLKHIDNRLIKNKPHVWSSRVYYVLPILILWSIVQAVIGWWLPVSSNGSIFIYCIISIDLIGLGVLFFQQGLFFSKLFTARQLNRLYFINFLLIFLLSQSVVIIPHMLHVRALQKSSSDSSSPSFNNLQDEVIAGLFDLATLRQIQRLPESAIQPAYAADTPSSTTLTLDSIPAYYQMSTSGYSIAEIKSIFLIIIRYAGTLAPDSIQARAQRYIKEYDLPAPFRLEYATGSFFASSEYYKQLVLRGGYLYASQEFTTPLFMIMSFYASILLAFIFSMLLIIRNWQLITGSLVVSTGFTFLVFYITNLDFFYSLKEWQQNTIRVVPFLFPWMLLFFYSRNIHPDMYNYKRKIFALLSINYSSLVWPLLFFVITFDLSTNTAKDIAVIATLIAMFALMIGFNYLFLRRYKAIAQHPKR